MAVQVLDGCLSESRKSRKSQTQNQTELILAARRNSAGKQARRDFWKYDIEGGDEECVKESVEETVEENVEGKRVDDVEECQYHPYGPVDICRG
jgi:hypothetical protein